MHWLLFVFISNGWGGGDLRQIETFLTEANCQVAAKILMENMGRVVSFACVPKKEEGK